MDFKVNYLITRDILLENELMLKNPNIYSSARL